MPEGRLERTRKAYEEPPKDAAYLLKFWEWVQMIDPDVIEAFEIEQVKNEELTEN